mmetsp:Transcript_7758/g.11527  ORF Transcript_7758/g.11527 Transcript_7758/m.11527 type:complete len:714 (+) Transcript_7758:199-2340(+)|eukprot:CAMPEP_0185019698 /NCGR_PEP_ID=MMETSP1103-20130426/2312_1 /TAXON_ID=36769 /ORGANISM="Paraphysomonas bandaiensis, Strain Caron Lab Isolate" /LENGTH=713 /DNA_ID=CAMNT_0027550159 /DNA_START=133 /DNA_END=2277 /DNA_ORIENTATION=-
MGLTDEAYTTDRDYVEYPMDNRYKKTSHAAGRRVSEINLSSFVRARNANAQKRSLARQKNRNRKYKASYVSSDDDSDAGESTSTTPSKKSPTVSNSRSNYTPPRVPSSSTKGSITPGHKSHYKTVVSNSSAGASITSSGLGSPRTPSRLTRNISDPISSSSSAFSSTLPAGLLSPSTPLNRGSKHGAGETTAEKSKPAGDAVSRAIFQALFGSAPHTSSSLNWMDDDDDDDEIDPLDSCRSVEAVDEAWFNRLIHSSLLTSRALDYALRGNSNISMPTGSFVPVTCAANSVTTPSKSVERIVVSPNGTATATNPEGVTLPPEDILSTYIDSHFITSLVDQLPFEDDRFTSPRVSVLKALYLNCPHLRGTLAMSLREVSYLRLLRCKVSSRLAVRNEVDPNHLMLKESFDYMDYIDEAPNASTSTPSTIGPASNLCSSPTSPSPIPSPEMKPKSTSLFPSLGPQIPTNVSGSASTTSGNTRDHDNSIVELALYMVITEPLPADSVITKGGVGSYNRSFILETMLHVVINVLKCYGRRLGKTTESVEQPAVLQNTLRILSELIPRMEVGAVDKLILPAIIRCWPGGGNSAREIAFLKALGVALPFCGSPSPSRSCPATIEGEIPPLTSFPRASSRYKCLLKITQCTTSPHFKVALEAVNLSLHPAIVIHFISDDDSECSRLLETLVDNLRANRTHWNVLVRKAAETALDSLLDQM